MFDLWKLCSLLSICKYYIMFSLYIYTHTHTHTTEYIDKLNCWKILNIFFSHLRFHDNIFYKSNSPFSALTFFHIRLHNFIIDIHLALLGLDYNDCIPLSEEWDLFKKGVFLVWPKTTSNGEDPILGSMECPFIAITLRSSLIKSGSTC